MKALFSSSASNGVWSSAVSDTDSSSSPFLMRSLATAFETSWTKFERFSCSSSMVMRGRDRAQAVDELALDHLAQLVASKVRSPSVWAARLMPSSEAATET